MKYEDARNTVTNKHTPDWDENAESDDGIGKQTLMRRTYSTRAAGS